MNLDETWAAFPRLETRRLILRPMTPRDADDHFALYSQPQVMAAHGVTPYEDVAESVALIAWYKSVFADKEAIRWGMALRGNGRLIGTCGFHNIRPKHFRGEIGFELHSTYWRQGLAYEAVGEIVRYGF
ncbi:MAG: GNAT family N-acetyltransferase, partial [Chloroflexi bacterium]|nr:GNAT family N-acetyltransferase [Chloroflexota bacterium]